MNSMASLSSDACVSRYTCFSANKPWNSSYWILTSVLKPASISIYSTSTSFTFLPCLWKVLSKDFFVKK